MITFGELKDKVASVVGSCTDEKQSELAISALKYLSINNAFGDLKKWTIVANDCYITLPHDLDVPKKVLINGNPRPVQNFWHEFNDIHSFDRKDRKPTFLCDAAGGGIRIEPSVFATAYDLPQCGGFVYFAPIDVPGSPIYEEVTNTDGSPVKGIIHGLEYNTGADIAIAVDDKMRRGEQLAISLNEHPRSSVAYREITNVIKPKTNNRIGLYWINGNLKGCLAEYDPFETRGRFRRAYIEPLARNYSNCCICLTILGTVKVKEYYDDNELLPFDTAVDYSLVLKSLDGAINASNSDELNVAIRQGQLVEGNIVKSAEKNMSPFSPVNVHNFRANKGARR